MSAPLSPEDAAAVLRRAAELDTTPLEEHDALDERVVREAAREVGLSEVAVDQAVREWRAGALAPLPELPADRWAGLPGCVVVERVVPLAPERAGRHVEGWLRGQWFERRRTRGPESEWAPRSGILAKVRRTADVQHTLRLSSVGRLRVCLSPAAAGTRVRLVADLGDTRAGLVAGLVAAPALLTAGGVAVGLDAGALADLTLALPAAAGVSGVGWLGARRALGRRHQLVAEELERALDELMLGRVRRGLPERAAAWALSRIPPQLR